MNINIYPPVSCHTSILTFMLYTQGQEGKIIRLCEHHKRSKGLRQMVEQSRNSFKDIKDIVTYVHKQQTRIDSTNSTSKKWYSALKSTQDMYISIALIYIVNKTWIITSPKPQIGTPRPSRTCTTLCQTVITTHRTSSRYQEPIVTAYPFPGSETVRREVEKSGTIKMSGATAVVSLGT